MLSKNTQILLLLISSYFLHGQEKCYTDWMNEKYNISDQKIYDQSFEDFYRNNKDNEDRDNEILYIPVHVIILHPNDPIGAGKNHSYIKVKDQIDAINRDFMRLNADTINTPKSFDVGNPRIQLCLASVDPSGNETDGISRVVSNKSFQANEFNIKSQTGWSRRDYLNIWVSDIDQLGFAYIPTNNSLPSVVLDGIVLSHKVFGGSNSNIQGSYNMGRTGTHELGHYLGLRHIWMSNGCNEDDGITDTPLQDKANNGCSIHPSKSCSNQGDMFMNYMDYSDDACMNAFTHNQSYYMRSILKSVRYTLLENSIKSCNIETTSTNEEISELEKFQVGPNPVKDNLAIRYSGNKNQEVSFEIYDIYGRLIVSEGEIKLSPEKNIHNFSVKNIENSIFIIKIATKFKSTHFMIIKD